MAVEIKVPQMGESISEVTIEKWLFKEGDAVEADRAIAVLESDKATVELPAESGGTITSILKKDGETARVGEVIAVLDAGVEGKKPKKVKQEVTETAQTEAPSTPKRREPEATPTSREQTTPPPLPPTAGEPKAPPPVPREPRKNEQEPTEVTETEGSSKPKRREPEVAQNISMPPAQAVHPATNGIDNESGREEEAVKMTRLRRTLAKRRVEAQ